MEKHIKDAEALLHKVESATQAVGLFLNAKKTKYMHQNPSSADPIHALDGSVIEKVDDFKYLGGWTDTCHDIEVRKAQAWGAMHALSKVWKAPIQKSTKIKIFKQSVESILLYSSDSWSLTKSLEKSLDGTYTRMIRMVQNISWREHMTNKQLYGKLSPLSSIIRQRRLALAGHIMRHEEPATQVLLWDPEEKRRVGRPRTTLKVIIERDTGLAGKDLIIAMKDRDRWRKDFVLSPTGIG